MTCKGTQMDRKTRTIADQIVFFEGVIAASHKWESKEAQEGMISLVKEYYAKSANGEPESVESTMALVKAIIEVMEIENIAKQMNEAMREAIEGEDEDEGERVNHEA
jgi:hypothetical protein